MSFLLSWSGKISCGTVFFDADMFLSLASFLSSDRFSFIIFIYFLYRNKSDLWTKIRQWANHIFRMQRSYSSIFRSSELLARTASYEWSEHFDNRQRNHDDLLFPCFGNVFLRFTMIPAKTNFTQIAVEMGFAQIVKNSEFCSFQKSAERFSGIVVNRAISIMALTVIHR